MEFVSLRHVCLRLLKVGYQSNPLILIKTTKQIQLRLPFERSTVESNLKDITIKIMTKLPNIFVCRIFNYSSDNKTIIFKLCVTLFSLHSIKNSSQFNLIE